MENWFEIAWNWIFFSTLRLFFINCEMRLGVVHQTVRAGHRVFSYVFDGAGVYREFWWRFYRADLVLLGLIWLTILVSPLIFVLVHSTDFFLGLFGRQMTIVVQVLSHPCGQGTASDLLILDSVMANVMFIQKNFDFAAAFQEFHSEFVGGFLGHCLVLRGEQEPGCTELEIQDAVLARRQEWFELFHSLINGVPTPYGVNVGPNNSDSDSDDGGVLNGVNLGEGDESSNEADVDEDFPSVGVLGGGAANALDLRMAN